MSGCNKQPLLTPQPHSTEQRSGITAANLCNMESRNVNEDSALCNEKETCHTERKNKIKSRNTKQNRIKNEKEKKRKNVKEGNGHQHLRGSTLTTSDTSSEMTQHRLPSRPDQSHWQLSSCTQQGSHFLQGTRTMKQLNN